LTAIRLVQQGQLIAHKKRVMETTTLLQSLTAANQGLLSPQSADLAAMQIH